VIESIDRILSVYDPLLSKNIKIIKIKESTGKFDGIFDATGKYFYGIDYLSSVVFGVDVETGKIIWKADNKDIIVETTKIVSGGYVNFLHSAVIARNRTGLILWQKSYNEIANSRLVTVHGHFGPAEEFQLLDEPRVIGISLLTGNKIWERNNVGYHNFVAMTWDGCKQCFFVNGKLEINALPSNRKVFAKKVNEEVDAVFTADGTKLICLPKLLRISQNENLNTEIYERRSHILKVFNSETGNIIITFKLAF
jgi:hypothetical protein